MRMARSRKSRILSSPHVSTVPSILRDFRSRFPGAVLDLEESTIDRQISSLADGHADIGFIALPFQESRRLNITVALDDEFVAVLPPEHRLAGADHVSLVDLS